MPLPLRWRRPIPPVVADSLLRWSRHERPDVDRALALRAPDPLLDLPELDDPWATAWLRADVESLARFLGALAGASQVRLVLAVVTGDRCRRFHVDHVDLRLITTYLGPTTEWIADPDVDRAVLAHPPACVDDANRRVLRAGGLVRHAAPDEILVLRGARAGLGTVHRSPPVAHLGLRRVVLAITAGSPTDAPP